MKSNIKSITLIPFVAAFAAMAATSCADMRSKPADNYGQPGNETNRHATDPTKHHHTGQASPGKKDATAKPGSEHWSIKKQ